MKVNRSLENRGLLLTGTTRKMTSQKGGFINDSLFIINGKCIYSITQKCFDTITIISRNVVADAVIQKKI